MDGRLPLKWGKDHFASFQTKQDTDFVGGTELTFTLKQEFNSGQHALGRFRLAVTDAQRPVSFGLPSDVKAIFAVSADKRTLNKKRNCPTLSKMRIPRESSCPMLWPKPENLFQIPKSSNCRTSWTVAQKPVPLPLKSPACEGLLN